MDDKEPGNRLQVPLPTLSLSLQIQPQQLTSSLGFKQDPAFLVYCLITELIYKEFGGVFF